MAHRPQRFEREWLQASLAGFLADATLIADVLYPVAQGKEASVYACRGGADQQHALVAAKVFRPRRYRNLRNDGVYRHGRAIYDRDGRVRSKGTRALQTRSRYGRHLRQRSWVEHEVRALRKMGALGVPVPTPLAATERVVLMTFIGDEDGPASPLNRLPLTRAEAASAWVQVREGVYRAWRAGLVHADLSAYNLLYHRGQVTFIDWPQVVDRWRNPWAVDLLQRDLERVCSYFASHGVPCSAEAELDLLLSDWSG